MTSAVLNTTFDCPDAYTLALFWSQVVDRPLADDDEPGDPEASIDLGNGSNLVFQTVPEPKTVKNRVHVCLRPDQARELEVERLLGIGATMFEDHRNPDGTGWAVLADPEGNEFCVLRSAAERAATTQAQPTS
jgi:predicted enzyme related to lactoylglutathione lyase